MNLRNTCPEIPDDWKGGIADTCRVLGGEKPVTEDFLRKWARIGRRGGGIDWLPTKKGRMSFCGKEIKRFWREFR